MIKPIIHMNGSDGRVLRDGYLKAADALDDAIIALGKTWPHARDYYVGEPGDAASAMAEHRARLAQLATMRTQMSDLAESCQDQLDKRKR